MIARHTAFRTILAMSVVLLVGCSSGSGGNGGDSGGNTPDNTSPVVTLTGDNPQIIAVGEAYAELGATASDNRDGDLTASIVINASAIDSAVPGTYQVTYDVTDAAGNAATTVTRTVTYEDRTPPVISLVGDDPLVLPMGSVYADPGASAADSVDGDISASITIDTSGVDSSTPGDYLVTYNVTDAAGNAATAVTRTVTVPLPVPAEATVAVTGDIKTLNFSWSEVDYVEHYRLMENADGHSGFVQVGDDIPPGTLTANRGIAVHLFDWVNAQYIVEACNVMGCSTSDVVTATDVMLDTIGYFKASNADPGDQFGTSIALSGDGSVLVIGAPYEDSGAEGVDGDPQDDLVEDSGAVYIFVRDVSEWAQQSYIKASNPGAGDEFGHAVAINSDGTVLAVGAPGEDSDATGVNGAQDNEHLPDAGAVYVFQYDGVRWVQQAYVKASAPARDTPRFGSAVALSSGGDRLVVGSPYEDFCEGGSDDITECPDGGAVYVFEFESEQWHQQAYLGPPYGEYEHFGASVALSADGNRLAAGAPDLVRSQFRLRTGAVFVYDYDGESWTGQLVGPPNDGVDFFEYDSSGGSLALSADGNRLAFDLNYWVFPGFERDGNWIAVYDFIGSNWQLQDWLRASNGISDNKDRFGGALAISGDGRTLAVGAMGEASIASGVNGDENDDSAERSGAAYFFALGSEGWIQTTYIKASNTDPVDMFGKALALSFDGEVLATGASGEDSSATGVNGDQAENSAPASGAVFVY